VINCLSGMGAQLAINFLSKMLDPSICVSSQWNALASPSHYSFTIKFPFFLFLSVDGQPGISMPIVSWRVGSSVSASAHPMIHFFPSFSQSVIPTAIVSSKDFWVALKHDGGCFLANFTLLVSLVRSDCALGLAHFVFSRSPSLFSILESVFWLHLVAIRFASDVFSK